MIEVHIFNSMLIPSLKETAWFGILTYINGLVAPAFLFASGFAFVLSTKNKILDLKEFKKPFWKKIKRIGLIFLTGYSLHLPYFSFSKILNKATPGEIISFFNVDILQCIAFGLIILILLRVLIKTEKAFNISIIVLTVVIILISPIIWTINFTNFLPVFISNYFNPQHGSLFPVFPWISFMFAGTIAGINYLKNKSNYDEENFNKNILVSGLIFTGLGFFFLSKAFPNSIINFSSNLFFFLERIGLILLLLALFQYYVKKRKTESSFVLDVSRESLLVYWLHLVILYGTFWNNKSIVLIINQRFGVFECIVLTILIAVLMILISKLVGYFRFKFPQKFYYFTTAAISIAVLIFFII